MSRSQLQTLGTDRIPADGVLVVPGRLDFAELQALENLFAGRRIAYLVEESAILPEAVRSHLERRGNAYAFSAADPVLADVGNQLRESLAGGGLLIHVPGRLKARAGTHLLIQGRILRALCALGLPTLPVAIHHPRETRLSFEPAFSLPASVLAVGRPVAPAELSAATLRQNLTEAFEEAFSAREFLNGSLARAVLHGLKKHSGTRIFDGADDSELPFSRLLAAAIALAGVIRQATDKPRIGIILPPGKAGMLANVAALLAGKVPVNLNFTAGHDAVKSAIRQADLDHFITADPFVRKIASFPWPPTRDLLLVERVLPTLQRRIIMWALLCRLLPATVLAQLLRIPRRGGNHEAVLLFTSGSSGEPKGVVLTHRNVLANVCQFGRRVDLPRGARILGALPLFHSFGITVTTWFPLIEGVALVTYPNPAETKRLGELIAQYQIYLLLSTPTFLRGYMKRVDPDQLASLGLAVTGAEKLPQSLAAAFEDRFGIRPQEGYGLTETSPGTIVNLPNLEDPELPVLESARNGSVGQLLPGLAVRVTDPATDQPIPIDHQGIIWFRGANVFPGYLDNPKKSAEVLEDGWFRTGDVGRVDDDGFLYIEGRISRFSKIGGEMVPHETVEAAINKALGLDAEAERKIAVIGVPDEQKGEAIVLLSTIASQAVEQECIDLRYRLLDAGLPSLWCPKRIIPVREIPLLASGKLDLKGCTAIVRGMW
jgi:acyl-[acyl-carrier-protein]-phospholipid O-acyltransferase/long-chain-fatty-acid--[acyl-carrier-protein] ligase